MTASGNVGGNPLTSKYLKSSGVDEVRQWHGMYYAKVVNTNDPLQQQRVTLNVPQVLGPAASNWATPAFPLSAAPAVNSTVLASFLGGDINRPMYMITPLTGTSVNMQSINTSDITISGTITNTALATLTAAVAALQTQVNNLLSGNVTIGGTLSVTGVVTAHSDVHVDGDLYGTGGTLTIGDAVDISGNPLTVDGTITSHTNINATLGTITGGELATLADISGPGTLHIGGVSSSGTVVATGNITSSGGAISGANTTNNFGGGGPQGGAVSTFDIGVQARLNDLLSALG